MSTVQSETVTFSALSRNPRAVAERATCLGRVRVTHRDAQDFYLTSADHEDRRDETLETAARMFFAIMKLDPGAKVLYAAMPTVFPWVHHLSHDEVRDFAAELIGALSDAAELDSDSATQEVIAGWRATARIKADPQHYRQALDITISDFGQVDVD